MPAPPSPSGSATVFVIRSDANSWYSARAECILLGLQLAMLRSYADHLALLRAMSEASLSDDATLWLGATGHCQPEPVCNKLKHWSWVDGTSLAASDAYNNFRMRGGVVRDDGKCGLPPLPRNAAASVGNVIRTDTHTHTTQHTHTHIPGLIVPLVH